MSTTAAASCGLVGYCSNLIWGEEEVVVSVVGERPMHEHVRGGIIIQWKGRHSCHLRQDPEILFAERTDRTLDAFASWCINNKRVLFDWMHPGVDFAERRPTNNIAAFIIYVATYIFIVQLDRMTFFVMLSRTIFCWYSENKGRHNFLS